MEVPSGFIEAWNKASDVSLDTRHEVVIHNSVNFVSEI